MALANQRQVEELANSLTECADSIHERLMKAVKNKAVNQAEAQATFQDETILRQRANSLYIDAASCVLGDLAMPQKGLMDVVDTAKAKIRNIKQISAFVDLVADLLALAAAAYAAKPGPILATLKEVKEDVEALKDT